MFWEYFYSRRDYILGFCPLLEIRGHICFTFGYEIPVYEIFENGRMVRICRGEGAFIKKIAIRV